MILLIFLWRFPADWLVYLAQTPPPDNLVTFLWIALGATVTVITVLAAYIRSLLAEIRQGDKDHYLQTLALAERVLTAAIEMKVTVVDNKEAIEVLSAELRSLKGRSTTRGGK